MRCEVSRIKAYKNWSISQSKSYQISCFSALYNFAHPTPDSVYVLFRVSHIFVVDKILLFYLTISISNY